ncbi:NTP-binding protein [Actinobacillus seminis]|uniref:Anti-sigma-factor antagonist n=1 Tax=Actinobacillus seminis TaxID=722 RepID=A0A263HD63_9PAST|nr:lipid asymmetry maintenance protein MlaB [Actinobacillus seminis]OZN25383.1 NTP-binding protein [Actinobacillus seminis]SUU35572.1 anti-sigma-factor antagonist [Actinobacillus seminis]
MRNSQSLHWELLQNDDNITPRLIGELSRDTLLPLWSQRTSFLSQPKLAKQNIVWDLTEITRIDSAGFALLCDFIHDCQQLQGAENRLQIKNPPIQLMTLADLFGLSDWITPLVQSNGKN